MEIEPTWRWSIQWGFKRVYGVTCAKTKQGVVEKLHRLYKNCRVLNVTLMPMKAGDTDEQVR